jgi:hypothetical protein
MLAGAKQPVVVHYVEHMPPDVTAQVEDTDCLVTDVQMADSRNSAAEPKVSTL